MPGVSGLDGLREDLLGFGGVLLEELGELLVDDAFYKAADLGVT